MHQYARAQLAVFWRPRQQTALCVDLHVARLPLQRCTFCFINAPFDNNRYRMRTPEAVVAEIDLLHNDYGVKTYKIIDEMFVLNERHVHGDLQIC